MVSLQIIALLRTPYIKQTQFHLEFTSIIQKEKSKIRIKYHFVGLIDFKYISFRTEIQVHLERFIVLKIKFLLFTDLILIPIQIN